MGYVTTFTRKSCKISISIYMVLPLSLSLFPSLSLTFLLPPHLPSITLWRPVVFAGVGLNRFQKQHLLQTSLVVHGLCPEHRRYDSVHPPNCIPLDEAKGGKELLQLLDHGLLPLGVAIVGFSDEHVGSQHTGTGYQVSYRQSHTLLQEWREKKNMQLCTKKDVFLIVVGRICAQAQELHNIMIILIFSLQKFIHVHVHIYRCTVKSCTIFIVYDDLSKHLDNHKLPQKCFFPPTLSLVYELDYSANIATQYHAWSTHLVRLICLHECWLAPLLHQGARESGEAEVVLHDTDYLPQEPPQGSEVVLFPRQEVLEDATQELSVM